MSADQGPPVQKKKSKLVLILGLLVFFGFLSLACCGGVGFYFYSDMMTGTRDAAIAALEADPAIADKLGTPIKADGDVRLGQFASRGQDGDAQIGLDVSGPNGSATIKAKMKKTAGTWTVERLTAETEDKSTFAIPGDDFEAMKAIMAVAKVKKTKGLISEVDFSGAEVTDDVLKQLGSLQALRSVRLNGTEASDSALEVLGASRSITNLDLRGCPISNDGLKHIAEMKQLKALRLNGESGATTVDDGGLEHLVGLTNLKVLALDHLWVSEAGLGELKGLEKLEELYIAKTLFGDDSVAALANFPKLKKLRISQTQLSDEGLAKLAMIKTLEDLDLSENSVITDVGMTHVGSLSNLTKLNLWRVALTDTGIGELAGLTKMKSLNVDNTQLTNDGLKHLSKMMDLQFLHLGSTQITDDGLPELAVLKNLKDLKITRTGCTEAGAAKLAEALPNTEIQLKYIEGK